MLGCLLFVWCAPLRSDVPFSPQPAAPAQESSDSQPAAQQQTANPPVLKRPPFRLAMLRKLYQCAGGVQLTLMQERDAVRVTLNGQIYNLKLVAPTQGATGGRYSDGAITWSLSDNIGTLQDATDPADPSALAKDCRPQSILPPLSAANSIHGMLNFVPRHDLPPTAQIRIQLLDLKASGEARKTISVQTFNLLGRKPPISFDFSLDSASAHSSDCCALYAEVLVDGKPQYATAEPHLIADITHPAPITLQLQPLHRKTVPP
jgi:uncharacterized lipoprotein YbaY